MTSLKVVTLDTSVGLMNSAWTEAENGLRATTAVAWKLNALNWPNLSYIYTFAVEVLRYICVSTNVYSQNCKGMLTGCCVISVLVLYNTVIVFIYKALTNDNLQKNINGLKWRISHFVVIFSLFSTIAWRGRTKQSTCFEIWLVERTIHGFCIVGHKLARLFWYPWGRCRIVGERSSCLMLMLDWNRKRRTQLSILPWDIFGWDI